MRILFLNPVGKLGGGERSLLDLIASLRAARPALDILTVAATDGPLLEEAARLGSRTRPLAMPEALVEWGESTARFEGAGGLPPPGRLQKAARLAAAGASYWNDLRRLVREERPSLLHSNGVKFHLLTASLPRSAPVVWHIRDFLSARPVMARTLRRAAFRADLGIANSEATAADARRVLGRPPVEALPNAIDTGVFSPGPGDGAALDAAAGLPPLPAGGVRAGLVAAYGRWKGQDVLLKAAALLKNFDGPPLRFYIVGGPIYRTRGSQFSEAELRGLAAELGVAESTGFVGFQRDPAPLLRALDIAVHASVEPEPFGRSIVEGMACGRAVVASAAGGAAEIFEEGVHALGTPPGDAAALAGAIAELARDPERRRALGEAGRRRAVERYSRERLAGKLLEIYSRLGCAP